MRGAGIFIIAVSLLVVVQDRVHAHIRVRMPLKPAVVRHFYAAKHYVVARTKAVHVKAVSKAYVHSGVGPAFQNLLRMFEIRSHRDFQIVTVTRRNCNLKPSRPRDLYIVSGVFGLLPVCGQNGVIAKPLRCLGAK